MTRNADRKARIRAVKAAQPNLNFSEAARRVDFTATAELLATLAPSPMAALAGALDTAGWHRDAARLADRLASRPEPDSVADRPRPAADDAATTANDAPPALTPHSRTTLERAAVEASNAVSDHQDPRDDPYDDEMFVVEAAVTGLRCAATLADGTAVAAAAADLLDMLFLDFTAEAIRGRTGIGPVARPARTESARRANAALHALAAAAATGVDRDREWAQCVTHLTKARRLARAAGAVDRSGNTGARPREQVVAHLGLVGVADAEEHDVGAQAGPRTDEPIDYQGPPLSPWRAAWLYAEVISDLYRGHKGPLTDDHRVLIAWTIGAAARGDGLVPRGHGATVAGPQALAAVSLVQVIDPYLDDLNAAVVFIRPDLGVVPVSGDPGVDAYRELFRAVTTAGLAGDRADLLIRGSAAQHDLKSVAQRWQDIVALAKDAAVQALFTVAAGADLRADILLAALGGHLNRFLVHRR